MYKQNQQKKKKNAKEISTFNFSILYTKILHDRLLDIFYKVVDFIFKGRTRDYIIINKQSLGIMFI